MPDREVWLSNTFVELADTLVDDFDVVDFLSLLMNRTGELVHGAEVGLVLADPAGDLRVMAASSERLRVLELFELQNDDGPCLEAYRHGEALSNVPLKEARARWPKFAPRAVDAGFRRAHAIPLRLRDRVIGAINILHSDNRDISEGDFALIRAMAQVATVGILQQRALHAASLLAEQLQQALNTRIVIEQAKGMLAERFHVDTDSAFGLMRNYARGQHRLLSQVASHLLAGTLPADALTATARRS